MIWCILQIQEFDFEFKDKKGCEYQVTDLLSLTKKGYEIYIDETIPNKIVIALSGSMNHVIQITQIISCVIFFSSILTIIKETIRP